jgi:hypothetical protein
MASDLALAPVHPLPTAKRDKTAAERQRRYRERKKEPVTAVMPPPVTPTAGDAAVSPAAVTRDVTAGVDVAAYAAAIALAGVAAVFSIRGMVVLFPGAPGSVVTMAVAMESAKLVTAGWLAARWRVTPWIARITLLTLVVGLAVINGVGVFSQLVAAHVGERGGVTAAIEAQDAALAAQIEVQAGVVADLVRRLGQIDTAIEEAAKRGKTSTALSAMEGQRKARAELSAQRQRDASTLADLKAQRAGISARARQMETESAPIRYVAEFLGLDTDSEKAIRWLIALMVLTCDPLAIALTAVASAGRGRP